MQAGGPFLALAQARRLAVDGAELRLERRPRHAVLRQALLAAPLADLAPKVRLALSPAERAVYTTRLSQVRGELKQRKAELQQKIRDDPSMKAERPERRRSEVDRRRNQLRAKLQARVHR